MTVVTNVICVAVTATIVCIKGIQGPSWITVARARVRAPECDLTCFTSVKFIALAVAIALGEGTC